MMRIQFNRYRRDPWKVLGRRVSGPGSACIDREVAMGRKSVFQVGMAKKTTKSLSPLSANSCNGSGSAALELVRDVKSDGLRQPAPQNGSGFSGQKTDHSVAVLEVEIDRLHSGRWQPRRRFAEESLAELAVSLEKTGVLQPIIVRRHGTIKGDFEIIAGERRWRAATLAGLPRVPVIVRDASDAHSLEMALVENVQREDLTPIELGEAYQRLLTEVHYTQERLGRLLGKSRSHVSNTVRLLKLPKAIKELVHERELSAGHARALINSENPVTLAKRVVSRKLSVRNAERLTTTSRESGAQPSLSLERDPATVEEPTLSALLGRRVTVTSADERYAITITCESQKDVRDVVGRFLTVAQSTVWRLLDRHVPR